MQRRNFIKAIPLVGMAGVVKKGERVFVADNEGEAINTSTDPVNTDRAYWASLLNRIATPVLLNLSKGQLKQVMPLVTAPGYNKPVEKVTYLEAFGRTMAGIAPWLELGADNTMEGSMRATLTKYALEATAQAVNPDGPDYMNFTGKYDGQPLVDGAFLAHAFIRAPKQLWAPLPATVKQQVISSFKSLRSITPGYSNWLLFSAIIEAALLLFGEEWDGMRVDYAVKKHAEWYKGDGMYGDGPDFHFDYYNAFVIHPMLTDILKVLSDKGKINKKEYDTAITRMQRYGVIQERLISPEGTFPVVGRSMVYRNAAFQPLVQLALHEQLPEVLSPAQVRCALTAVMKNIFETKGTFDDKGWLQPGFCGYQPEIADVYTATGSLYLCTTGFLALGLPPEHAFWAGKPEEWTAQRAWKGKTVFKDHAL
ncbi:DUF2264 domain-containing protein [Chitinophaga oryziterrae]|uniref:DUF2264 domain-containing protein n=1 Tax=Chitinophaga oryziterrae TaxID=1031224 RepID=A0A6N8J3E8_9BACT|nr:DUF2264 domain-containing protein [Chitinophaga oryziterrae]MVT39454.1 DUF2264 domain-containing protein [Chitinophaga oryziterrae]